MRTLFKRNVFNESFDFKLWLMSHLFHHFGFTFEAAMLSIFSHKLDLTGYSRILRCDNFKSWAQKTGLQKAFHETPFITAYGTENVLFRDLNQLCTFKLAFKIKSYSTWFVKWPLAPAVRNSTNASDTDGDCHTVVCACEWNCIMSLVCCLMLLVMLDLMLWYEQCYDLLVQTVKPVLLPLFLFHLNNRGSYENSLFPDYWGFKTWSMIFLV